MKYRIEYRDKGSWEVSEESPDGNYSGEVIEFELAGIVGTEVAFIYGQGLLFRSSWCFDSDTWLIFSYQDNDSKWVILREEGYA